jgi:hypothetical protein
MYLVQMLLPLYDRAGRKFSQEHFSDVREELTQRYGGMTAYLRSPAEGTWREPGGSIDRDEMVMCEVMVEELDRAWWSAYRKHLERRFDQAELVVRASVLEKL